MLNAISKLTLGFAALVFAPLAAGAQTLPAALPTPATNLAVQPDNISQIASRGALIVREFAVSDKVGWPYDIKQLQTQAIAELRAKSGEHLDVLIGAPATPRTHTYTLEGEIVSWHPGNRAKRMMIGMGSGRESAEIHYWLTDNQGKKVFEHKDTIRAEFLGKCLRKLGWSIGSSLRQQDCSPADRGQAVLNSAENEESMGILRYVARLLSSPCRAALV